MANEINANNSELMGPQHEKSLQRFANNKGVTVQISKILNFRNLNVQTCRMPTKMDNFKLKCLIVFR